MKLFGSNKNKKEQGGVVKISGNYLICKGREANSPLLYDDKVNIAQLENVYLVIDEYGTKSLHLSDPTHYHVPISFEGFDQVYQQLSKRYGFDDELFYKYLHTNKPVNVCLWRKQYPANYQLLAGNFEDITEGFEIQSPQKEFVSWDLSLEELKKYVSVKTQFSLLNGSYLSFKYPIRMGAILLQPFPISILKNRIDAPVLSFYVRCYHPSNSVTRYDELKAYFSGIKGLEDRGGFERNDQRHWLFDAKGVWLGLTYWFDSENGFDSGYTSFSVENKREYPALLENTEYENSMELSDYLILDSKEDIHFSGDYKKDAGIKRRPPILTERFDDKPVIWRDDRHHKIGFSVGEYAYIFDKKEVKSMAIGNVLPAKAAGYADLFLNLKSEKYKFCVMMGDCHSFDSYVKQMEQVTRKKLKFLPEGINC